MEIICTLRFHFCETSEQANITTEMALEKLASGGDTEGQCPRVRSSMHCSVHTGCQASLV